MDVQVDGWLEVEEQKGGADGGGNMAVQIDGRLEDGENGVGVGWVAGWWDQCGSGSGWVTAWWGVRW